MTNTKVKVIDLLRKNEEHYVFNSLSIKAIHEKYDTEIWVSEDSTYLDELDVGVKVNHVQVKRSKTYNWIISSFNLSKLILQNIGENTKIIVLSATPIQYTLISLISMMIPNNIYLFMHGELAYLKWSSCIGQKIGRLFIKIAMKMGRVKFICIGHSIQESLAKIFPKRSFQYVQHPIVSNFCSKGLTVPLTFGSFGIHSQDKGSNKVYDLACCIENMHFTNCKIITVGISDGSFKYDLHNKVSHYCKGNLKKQLIAKELFYEFLLKIDVALIFSNVDEENDSKYDLISSGVLADCIAFGMPVIALKNKQLVSYFKKYGEFGFLCDTVNDMAVAVRELSNNPKLILSFKDVLKKIRKDFEFEMFKSRMNEIINEK